MFNNIHTQGLDVLEGESRLSWPVLEDTLAAEGDEISLDLTPGAADPAVDPVRTYLRQMAAAPLLSREGEVEIAKRIERGKLSSMKALSRSPLVILQILAMGEDLKLGLRPIQRTVVFDEEEDVTDEMLKRRVDEVTGRIGELRERYEKRLQLAKQLEELNPKEAKTKSKKFRRLRYQLCREIVQASLIVRRIQFTNLEWKRLGDRLRKAADVMEGLERQAAALTKKIALTKS
nr:RNA polymerase sigma factor RpoD [Terriglobales bacterium]